jgi:hypothetical protein
MRALQQRARPRSKRKLRIGTLSRTPMGAPQLGQRDAGNAMFSPRGKR